MIAKGISTNKTKVILDNCKDSKLLSNLKFFGAVETKKTKRYTYFNCNRNKKETLEYLKSADVQSAVEVLM